MKQLLQLLPAVVIALSSCSARSVRPFSELEHAVRNAKFSELCGKVIPMEWPSSWPIPTGNVGGREFKIAFYSMSGLERDHSIAAPLGEAVFNTGTGAVSRCRRFSGKSQRIADERWPERISKMSIEEFEAHAAKLYDLTEQASVLYAYKKPPSTEGTKVLQNYSRLFAEMAEPALLKYYYEMNPVFWQWLSKNGARTLSN